MPTINESRKFTEAATPAPGTGMLDVVFITEGWGSSGYYAGPMLQEAANDKVFPAGTQMFVNHPTATEAEERPVRDLAHLAGVLTEDATWDEAVKGLRGTVKTFPAWRESLSEMAPYIGVSIRAGADVEEGEVDGRTGVIVTRITEGLSVDFVTRAGRGGHVVEVLESAMEKGATSSVAYFTSEDAATTGPTTTHVPVAAPSGSPITESNQEDQMPTLEEAQAAVTTLTQERDTALARAEEAERTLARQAHISTATSIVGEAFAAADVVAPKTVAVLATQFTLNEAGEVDTEALKTLASEAAAELAEARGQGQVKGLGHGAAASGEDISDAELLESLARISGRTTVKGA